MNERIKELARQCYKAGPIGKDGWPEYTTFNEEKFAELIIKECAKVCYRTGVLEQDERMGWMYGDAIQEHFEVE